MRYTTALELGISPDRQSSEQRIAIEKEILRRLFDNWQNKCDGPAIALVPVARESEATFDRLLDLAQNNEDWLIRRAAIWALGLVGNKQAIPVLSKITKWWRIAEMPELKRTAKDALRLMRGKLIP